jgi:hypothetical protein
LIPGPPHLPLLELPWILEPHLYLPILEPRLIPVLPRFEILEHLLIPVPPHLSSLEHRWILGLLHLLLLELL